MDIFIFLEYNARNYTQKAGTPKLYKERKHAKR